MTCEREKRICVVCFEKKATAIIDDCYLCPDCASLSRDNFLLKCGNCGCATNIKRTEHNIARIARIMLDSQNICGCELHLNLMFLAVQKERPIIIPLNYCPHCAEERNSFAGAKKIKPAKQIPNVIF